MSQISRKMTVSEREFLDNLLSNSPSRTKQAVENFFVVWAASTLLLVLTWLLLNWLCSFFTSFDFGLKSAYSFYIMSGCSIATFVYSFYSTTSWMKSWEDIKPKLKQELSEDRVFEETHQVVDVKRFQEPEHGGIIYFLRMSDDRTLVLYDYESTELYMDGKDPLTSSFSPKREVKLVRSPHTDFFITQEFLGDTVDISVTGELMIEPDEWPAPESWCDISWDLLESKLARE